MTFTSIINKLDNEGMDTVEVKAMVEAFKDAKGFNEIDYYQNQLYGFICGLAALKYITPDDVNEIMNNLESGDL